MTSISLDLITIIWTNYNIKVAPYQKGRIKGNWLCRALENYRHIKRGDVIIAREHELKKL